MRCRLKVFKHEILDILSHLDNERLKSNRLLFKKFAERYISLVPNHIRPHVNWALLENSRDYRAWFANRQMFVLTVWSLKIFMSIARIRTQATYYGSPSLMTIPRKLVKVSVAKYLIFLIRSFKNMLLSIGADRKKVVDVV